MSLLFRAVEFLNPAVDVTVKTFNVKNDIIEKLILLKVKLDFLYRLKTSLQSFLPIDCHSTI